MEDYILSQPGNTSNGVLKGVEVGLVYFPESVPQWLDGIGLQASGTFLRIWVRQKNFVCGWRFWGALKSWWSHTNFLTDPNIFQNVPEIMLKHRHIRYLDIRKNNNSISCLNKKFNRAQNVAVFWKFTNWTWLFWRSGVTLLRWIFAKSSTYV